MLMLKGPPKSPSNVRPSDETSQTVNITFMPEFNGGSVQTFRVEYKLEEDPDQDEYYTLFKEGAV